MTRTMRFVRQWIDNREYGPIVAAQAVTLTPVVIGMWILAVLVNTPWWTMPVVLGSAVLVVGWVVLACAALTRWFP